MNVDHITDIAKSLCQAKHWGAPTYIDHGASAVVFSVEISPGEVAALKVYDPELFEGDNALIETNRIKLQQDLKGHGSPYLVDIEDAEEIASSNTWYLLMEFCPWPSLEKVLAKVPAERIQPLIKQLALAVQFLADRGLVHRDIKPANIVVSPDWQHLKLLDFGVMRRVAFDEGSGTDGHKFIATAQYSPPEFLLREEMPGSAGYDPINVYQIGAVLHDLITGTPLFAEEKGTKNKFKLFKAVTEKRPRIVSNRVAPRLIALCNASLEKDPTLRAGGVSLDDYLVDTDGIDALRKRLASRRPERASGGSPLVAAWSTKVASWGRAAGSLEAVTLGAFQMKLDVLPSGHRWRLKFQGAPAPIYLRLSSQPNCLVVSVGSAQDASGRVVVRIDSAGPDLAEMGIPDALAAEYLFALDLALSESPEENAGE